MVSHEPARLGRIVGLWRYPIKSMAAEPLDEAHVTWQGITGDRRWAFVRAGLVHSGFPWLTLRQLPTMNQYRPAFQDPSQPESSKTLVTTPTGVIYDVTDPKLAAELHPDGARVLRQARGAFDAFPLSLISIQSIEALSHRVGFELEPARFRPNLLIDAEGGEPFIEDSWVGQTLRMGQARVRIDKRDGRCVVISTDPQTGSRSSEVLKAVVTDREGCLGVYGSTVTEGTIRIGDGVSLESA